MTQITADTPACEVWKLAADASDEKWTALGKADPVTERIDLCDQAATAILEQAFAARDATKDARISELEAREKALREENEKLREAARCTFELPNCMARATTGACTCGSLNQGDRP